MDNTMDTNMDINNDNDTGNAGIMNDGHDGTTTNNNETYFLPHFLAGLFLIGYGVFYLVVTLYRIRHLLIIMSKQQEQQQQQDEHEVLLLQEQFAAKTNNNDDDDDGVEEDGCCCDNNNDTSASTSTSATSHATTTTTTTTILAQFLYLHVPERNPKVLKIVSKYFIGCTIFGLLYTCLGARYLNHDVHPDYGFFHYTTHITLLLLYLFVGYTTNLEINSYLPQDSTRVAIVVALFGETILWYDHSFTKTSNVERHLHFYLGLISAITSICLLTSILRVKPNSTDNASNTTTSTTTTTTSPILDFILYVGTFVGFVYQGLWFEIIAIQQKKVLVPTTFLTSSGQVTSLLVILALSLLVGCQLVIVAMIKIKMHHHHHLLHHDSLV